MSRRPDAVLFSNTQRFRPVLRALREIDFDPGPILASFDVTEAQLLDPHTRVPRDLVVRLSRALAVAVGDADAIGVRAATHFQLTDLGLLGYILRHSEHVLGALQRFARYSRLMADAAECQVSVKPGRVVVRLGIAGARPISPQGIDYGLATLLVGMRELTPAIGVLSARLARPKPNAPKVFHDLFGVRVEFGAPHTEIAFDPRGALQPAAHHDPQLLAILEHQAQTLLSELPQLDSFIEQVREVIAAGLSEDAHGCEQIAKGLGVSVRTLRRRLASAGLSHRSLRDELRRERALALVARGDASIVEVAQQVGFSDPSAFAAAFRRWTGRSPGAMRRVAKE